MALATPVEKDGFSYAGGDLYCQSSNFNRHRRATLPELKAHFNGKDKEDRPAHWYEAQLIHYGLPPSKVKGTAHKRLFDAVTKGGLSVPANIKKIENDLKKEWVKKEREAKKVVMESAAAKSSPAVSKGTKRKAPQATASNNTVTITTTYTINGAAIIQDAAPAAKKPKTTPKKVNEPKATKAPLKTTPKTTPKMTPKKANEPKATKTPPKKASVPKASKPMKAPAAPKSSSKVTSQRAGPSRPAPAVASSSRAVNHDYDEPPPPYSEFGGNNAPASRNYRAHSQHPSPRPKLGLLNGRYDVSCPDIEDDYPEYRNKLSLIVTMDGNELWVKFDFGELTGMMNLPRPWDSGEEEHVIHWRGQSYDEILLMDTDYLADDCNYLIFLGDGHIRGSISRHRGDELHFDAYRVPGQGPYSEVTRNQAREEWDQLPYED